MKKIFTAFLVLASSVLITAQTWEQTAGTPQGGGVTDLLVRQTNGFIFATTGSYNWPQIPGGVRVSTDDGATWQTQTNSYVARTIVEGPDGYIYASIWPDPALFPGEGIYRSVNNGAAWNPLYFVSAGDNIFSIVVKFTDPSFTIFAGTRNGIIRSTDYGSTFQNSGSGIPANSWVRDLKLTSDGAVIAATTNGVFFSTNNGDTWNQAQGVSSADTVSTITDLPPQLTASKNSSKGGFEYIMASTIGGKILRGIWDGANLVFEIVYVFTGNPEIANVCAYYYFEQQTWILFAALYATFGTDGGVARSLVMGDDWEFLQQGLSDQLISALELSAIFGKSPNQSGYNLYAGTYLNQPDGAKIYKLTEITSVESYSSEIPSEFKLNQNFPNPFNPTTKISWQSPAGSIQTLKVYDIMGREIATLVNEYRPAGKYEINFDASSLPSGIYFYRLNTGSFSETRKMSLLK